jgi:hypothetical protein
MNEPENNNVTPNIINELDLERWYARKAFFAALAKAQGSMAPAVKNARAHHGTYANLESVIEVIKKYFAPQGLSITQETHIEDRVVSIRTRLHHEAGHSLSSTITCTSKSSLPQDIGSAITYMKRYGLQALCGIPSEDDDGNLAQGTKNEPEPSNELEMIKLMVEEGVPELRIDAFLKDIRKRNPSDYKDYIYKNAERFI